MKYIIKFLQYRTYEVEADSEDKAIEQAENEFCDDMRSPVANVLWDEMIIEDENGQEIDTMVIM